MIFPQQCLYRRLKEYGLLESYLSDLEFQEQFKYFSGLAFIHPDDVERIHRKMMDELITFDSLKDFNRIYFEKTWIRNNERPSGKAVFPISIWNVHQRLVKVSTRAQDFVIFALFAPP